MSLPTPIPGLVIRYAYLWKREFELGHEDGSKDRPCALVMTVANTAGSTDILVLPITHSPPPDPADGIEIPAATKQRLGLDSERSWIVISEANEFVWPGPDLRPIAGGDASTIAYGVLPPRLFAFVRDRFVDRYRQRRAARVRRSE